MLCAAQGEFMLPQPHLGPVAALLFKVQGFLSLDFSLSEIPFLGDEELDGVTVEQALTSWLAGCLTGEQCRHVLGLHPQFCHWFLRFTWAAAIVTSQL